MKVESLPADLPNYKWKSVTKGGADGDGAIFRYFPEDPTTENHQKVKDTYYEMHTTQTTEYVRRQHEYWCKFDKTELPILDALEKLDDFIDDADPDVEHGNSYHAFQTAERIRQKFPDLDWLQVTGLVHDLGKVMGLFDQPMFANTGDTFPVGLAPRESIVYGVKSFKDNPDIKNKKYNTKYGIYKENIGLENLMISWGHDEYMYQVLKNHPGCTLPKEGLWCIRYHSFYPWHHEGDYQDLCTEEDKEILKWVNIFNEFDLYSKTDEMPQMEELKPYYQSLIDKYIPGPVKF